MTDEKCWLGWGFLKLAERVRVGNHLLHLGVALGLGKLLGGLSGVVLRDGESGVKGWG